MSLMAPELWQGTPFRHTEAMLDFLGFHDKWHAHLARKVGPPVADYRFDNLPEMGDIHQDIHVRLTRAIGLSGPQDFSLFDIRQRAGWVLFMQSHSLEHDRLRAALGI